ncbi:MAG TPA: hypothetical protein VJ242_02135 [Patescibacteria group bacterium]|nr:hypothetical protein [Patescibacteria group bacterium]
MVLDAVVTEPKLNPYKDLSPIEYVGMMRTVNENAVDHLRQIFQDLPLAKDQCVVTIGSDGKGERHGQSKTEFMVIQNELHPPIVPMQIRRDLSKSLHRNVDSNIELKTLEDDRLLSLAFKNRKLVYPDRVLNAGFIIGNQEIFHEARKRVLQEMTAAGPESRRLREYMERQLWRYKKSIKTGLSRDVETFSASEGWQYYNETPPHTGFGFKHGFLRATQRKFDILTARWIKQGVVTIDRLVEDLPTNTYEKFDYFSSMNLLSPNLARGASEAYAWFLQQYHQVQETYQETREPVVLDFSTRALHEHAHPLTRFLNLLN